MTWTPNDWSEEPTKASTPVAPTRIFVRVPEVVCVKLKSPVSETNPAMLRVICPAIAVTSAAPSPLKSRLTLPAEVWTEVGMPVTVDGSRPCRLITVSPEALSVRPGTPFSVSVPPLAISAYPTPGFTSRPRLAPATVTLTVGVPSTVVTLRAPIARALLAPSVNF